MTAKQKRFAEEYLIDLNATQAAIRAGYSSNPRSAEVHGHNLLRNAKVQAEITEQQNNRSKRTGITQDLVLTDIEAIKQDAMQSDDSDNFAMRDRASALKACELQGRHLRMFTDKSEHSGDLTLTIRWQQ